MFLPSESVCHFVFRHACRKGEMQGSNVVIGLRLERKGTDDFGSGRRNAEMASAKRSIGHFCEEIYCDNVITINFYTEILGA